MNLSEVLSGASELRCYVFIMCSEHDSQTPAEQDTSQAKDMPSKVCSWCASNRVYMVCIKIEWVVCIK